MESLVNDSRTIIDVEKVILPNHEPTKHSTKRNGLVYAYAANTN